MKTWYNEGVITSHKTAQVLVTPTPFLATYTKGTRAMDKLDSTYPANNKQYFVYIIQSASGPVKIGWATDVERRLKVLQSGHAAPLSIAFVFHCRERDVRKFESFLHQKYKAKKLRREWFDMTPEQVVAGLLIPGMRRDIDLRALSERWEFWGNYDGSIRMNYASGIIQVQS